jgi:hypothetical protein
MAVILSFPSRANVPQPPAPKYADRLKTAGEHWVRLEKRLLDQAEFLEAMILVLDDVKLTNIRNRDYAMMDVVSEEIPRYQQRLEDIQKSLTELRRDYMESQKAAKVMAN